MLHAPSPAENCGEPVCDLNAIAAVSAGESETRLNQQNSIIAAEVLIWVKRYMHAADANWATNDQELIRNSEDASRIAHCGMSIAHGDCRKFIARKNDDDHVEIRHRFNIVR